MKTLVFFLEELSAEAMLKGVLPRLLPADIHPAYFPFPGKQALEKELLRKLRGWRKADSMFVVLRDQDRGDCRAVKETLAAISRAAGRPEALVRIACRELESFYLGDLAAVEKGLGLKGLRAQQGKEKFRNPDLLADASGELRNLTNKAYQKISGSRAIAPHLVLENNRSPSFRALITGIRRLVAA
ncbi:hypothetical protein NNJEOMEG_02823 [Fundidesulfovibrio magnetotacticus]|uniref:DUF4276 family protein n=1 Tax=Fundidesulfovibrio magnetotacticus TaxID=2730080 RepID=A0A6V8M3D8_9BACT|nr:DUF4276 family protein [Fundidesulfovibrio magnetotacticus]GFK94975.1 hypothetical protein NNJEOMEG_02823 [Fundidesulfovibrio magnetotacticus]